MKTFYKVPSGWWEEQPTKAGRISQSGATMRKLARQPGDAMHKDGETAETEGGAAYEKLVEATQAIVRLAQQVVPVL